MDIETLRQLVEPFVTFFMTIIVSGYATTHVVEVLKMKIFPEWFWRHPRLTNAVASILATIAAIYMSPDNIVINTPLGVAALVIGTLLTSAITYNNLYRSLGK